MTGDLLPMAVRAWTVDPEPSRRRTPRAERPRSMPGQVLVFDCETTIDAAQALKFGSYRYYTANPTGLSLLDEGLFYADDLPTTDPTGFARLGDYCRERRADHGRPLRLMSRSDWAERVFFKASYKARAAVVGFNLPFDLSRIAIAATDGRGAFRDGFSFILHSGKNGRRENKHRPRVLVKNIDAHRALISLGKRLSPDPDDQIPEDSIDGQPNPRYVWRGRFVDLHSLAFALTGKSHTLDSACEAFGLAGKHATSEHGRITAEYIDYCRQDVAATADLYQALVTELERHPIDLRPEKAYSSASVAKSYLRAMGIRPALEQNPDFPNKVLGAAMSAFYGGRSETMIRRQPLPVALVDFTSMYPTVDTLMGLWRHLTAARIDPVDATDEIRQLLATITFEDCFDPNIWTRFVGIVQVVPDGHLLPVRAQYDPNSPTWTTALQPLDTEGEPLWYTIADCIAATLHIGRPPAVVQAIRFEPIGQQDTLTSTNLRGAVPVDPTTDDFFRTVIEQRAATRANRKLPDIEREALSTFLKVLANSGSYGIHSEFIRTRLPSPEVAAIDVYGREEAAFQFRTTTPEHPGEWCFPPFATVITGAARLMLSLLELAVSRHGGEWVFCDTDSMAIVVTPDDLDERTDPAVTTAPEISGLRLTDVQHIRAQFNRLNPYDPANVADLLKLEEVAMCFAVSPKRYALYRQTTDGDIEIIDASRHGLGHLLNPKADADPEPWTHEAWRHAILNPLHGTARLGRWADHPTVSRATITTPEVIRTFDRYNRGLLYRDQVKPFNFVLLTPGAKPPANASATSFRLIAQWEPRPTRWPSLLWFNLHDRTTPPTRITTRRDLPGVPLAESYRTHLGGYLTRPDAKTLDPHGWPSVRSTTCRLARRPVRPAVITHIGKEANRLADRATGLAGGPDNRNEYGTTAGDALWQLIRHALRNLSPAGLDAVADRAGVSTRTVYRMRNSAQRPNGNNPGSVTSALLGRTSRPHLSAVALRLAQFATASSASGPEPTHSRTEPARPGHRS